jgi:predicted nucleic-acid-binding Zn-ribbon protein
METKNCPKCGSPMQADKHLQSLGTETELVTEKDFFGDTVRVFCCENEKCGYIELYRETK